MNCVPEPVPTFALPAKPELTVHWAEPAAPVTGAAPDEPALPLLAVEDEEEEAGGTAAAAAAPPEQVDEQLRPACVVTSCALQSEIPLDCATQQPDAQSAALKH